MEVLFPSVLLFSSLNQKQLVSLECLFSELVLIIAPSTVMSKVCSDGTHLVQRVGLAINRQGFLSKGSYKTTAYLWTAFNTFCPNKELFWC